MLSFAHDHRTIGFDPVPDARWSISGRAGVVGNRTWNMRAGLKGRKNIVALDAEQILAASA